MTSSIERNKQIVCNYIREIVNTGNVSEIFKYIHPDYVEVYKNVRHPIGIDGAKKHILGVRNTYPDLNVAIEKQIAENDWVVTQIIARGTHKGEWLGIKPTGLMVEYTGVNIDKISDNLIIEHDGAANLLETLLEIGAIKIVGKSEG